MNFSIPSPLTYIFTSLALAICAVGCESNESTSNSGETDHHDHSHDHGHHHTEPRFGGDVIEVGHTHNPNGLLFYYAEVLPSHDGSVQFYLSVEDEAGGSKAATSKESEVMAYMTDAEQESGVSKEVVFQLQEINPDGPVSVLSATIPVEFANSSQIAVVVPKVTLGGERLSFSFEVEVRNLPDSIQTNNSEEESSEPNQDKETAEEDSK